MNILGLAVVDCNQPAGYEGMEVLRDLHNRQIRFTDERRLHIEIEHPEMDGQIEKVRESLPAPDRIVRSLTDPDVELFYRYYKLTPVTRKYLCVVVKVLSDDQFIITTYFTDTVKRDNLLWGKK